MTLSDLRPTMLRSLRLRMYWDGASKAAVDAPLGDFFGMPLGRMVAFESAFFSSPEGRSFCCHAPMPFRRGMRIRLDNEGPDILFQLYYEVAYTLGDPHGEGLQYFHAHYRCENPTTPGRDYELLPTLEGRGRFLGSFVAVAADTAAYGRSWWGEGEVKIWADDDGDWPSLCGTGTEDWIGAGWELGAAWSCRSQGCHLADAERFRYGFYRFHLEDPVVFSSRLRVAVQQIGSWRPESIPAMRASGRRILHAGPGSGAGSPEGSRPVDLDAIEGTQPYGLFERRDLWSSCAFFTLERPSSGLPALDPVGRRLEDLPDREEMDGAAMRNVPIEYKELERLVPGLDRLGAAELEALRDRAPNAVIRHAAAVVAAALRSQEAILGAAWGGHD